MAKTCCDQIFNIIRFHSHLEANSRTDHTNADIMMQGVSPETSNIEFRDNAFLFLLCRQLIVDQPGNLQNFLGLRGLYSQ